MPDLQRDSGKESEGELFRLLVENVQDYAIFVIDAQGLVQTWNSGAERLLGWREEEILGQSSEVFFTPEDVRNGVRDQEMRDALEEGRGNDDRWHVRKDGSRFWAGGVMTPLWDENHQLRGFAKIMRDRTEWKQAADEKTRQTKAAERRQRLYDAVLSNTPDLVYVFDLQHRFSYANEGLLAMWGRSWDEAIGKTCLELGYPDWHAAMHDREIDQVVATKLPIKGEVPFTGTFGRRIYEYIFVPVIGEDGEVEAVAGTTRDVTDRHQSEEQLRHSEEHFRSLMEQAPFSIQLFSPDGRTIRVNRAWEELWGIRFEQIAEYNVLEDPQLEARGVLPYIQMAFRGEATRVPAIRYNPNETIPDVTQQPHPDRWLSAVIYPLKDADGRVREVVLIHEDITARYRAEEAVRERDRLYRAIGESIDYGVWVCEPSGRNIYVSDSFLRLVGMTQEQCSVYGWGSVLHPDDVDWTLAAWQECVRTGSDWDMEHRFRGVDGRWHPVLARGVPVRNEQGEITAWAGINLDISRLKQVENELREADRRKDEFLATLAHELRNPLAPIRNSLQILKLQRVDPEMMEQTRDMMERQVHHLVRLVDDLLDVSRVMRAKIELRKEPVELASIVARAVETALPLIEVQEHRLDVSLPADSLLLDADPVRMAQVVGNLLTNAAKYTDANGQIWLTADREEGQVTLKVRDTGIGIAPEMLPRVFDLFVQADHAAMRSQGGLGIGLTLVKNLVEMHGGTVAVSSAGLGKGSEFVVRLPLIEPEPSTATETPQELSSPEPVRETGHRLLVVDDNEDAAVSLALLLRLKGHEVRAVHDGAKAIETAKTFRPELIFLDIGMPGLDGYEVARRLRQQPGLQHVVLAALTGWGQHEDRRRTAEAGFDHHLVKPPEPELLERLLDALPKREK